MIRLLSYFLILSMLTLNIAWVADTCALTNPADSMHASASLQADNLPPVDLTSSDLCCDDWCDAWVGHIAVVDQPLPAPDVMSIFPTIAYACHYTSLRNSPPFHPPIA